MIPLKLELKNFLSYGEPIQTIDFNNHRLICLSGKNGNGKSALLDAITWAIWGQARKTGGTSKADEGLIRLGQTRMLVALTFMFNKKTYRVRREFSKTYGKPLASLDFEIFDDEFQAFRSLTDKTIRATQAGIEQTINLDFETFINSAFLKQGQSNEFSKKTAKERKQILATILGLSKYDELQQQANAEARLLEQSILNEQKTIELLEKDVSEEKDLNTLQIQKKTAVESLQKDLTQQLLAIEQASKEIQRADEQAKLKQFLSRELENIETQYLAAGAALKNARHEAQQLSLLLKTQLSKEVYDQKKTAILSKKKLQTEIMASLAETIKTLHEKQKTLQQKSFTAQQEQLNKIQAAQLAHDSFALTLEQIEKELCRLGAEVSKNEEKAIKIKTEIDVHQATLDSSASLEKTLSTVKKQFEKRRVFFQNFVQLGNRIKEELKDLDTKKNLLMDRELNACPLCLQTLTENAQQHVTKTIETKTSSLKHKLGKIGSVLTNLKKILVLQHEELTLLEQKYVTAALSKSQIEEKKQIFNELSTHSISLKTEQNTLNEKKTTVRKNIQIEATKLTLYSTPIEESSMREIQAIKKDIQDCEIIKQKYENALAAIGSVDDMIADLDILHKAISNRDASLQTINTLKQKAKELLVILRSLKKQRLVYQSNLASIREIDTIKIQETIATLNNTIKKIETEKNELTLELGSLTSKLERIAAHKKIILEKQTAIKSIQEEATEYSLLGTAFGKNGIQALLIEEAIPEIEAEANELLAKLTDNQAQIFIESLRDLKNGGVKETLEIKVSDAAGMRPYEMFSGGEAFRIDFAIRIAISKLLSRRAGTALQTLIIDEGFGSQDNDGLDHIMNALYAIQTDFAKIIVVSHLNEFKENFPVHFIVEKSATGSIVRIDERG